MVQINKTLGYIIMAIGAIIFLLSFPSIAATIKLTLPSSLSTTWIMVVGAVILLVGAFLATRGSSGKKVNEVPIYEGKDVVGFRRLKK